MKKWDRKEIDELAKHYVEIAKIMEPDDMIHEAFCAGFIEACKYQSWVTDEWTATLRDDAQNP